MDGWQAIGVGLGLHGNVVLNQERPVPLQFRCKLTIVPEFNIGGLVRRPLKDQLPSTKQASIKQAPSIPFSSFLTFGPHDGHRH